MKLENKISDYLRKNRKGKAANRLERDALADPFLYESLEGFTDIPGDHVKAIEDLSKRLKKRTESRMSLTLGKWAVAASLLIAVVVSLWLIKYAYRYETMRLAAMEESISASEITIMSVDTVLLMAKQEALVSRGRMQNAMPLTSQKMAAVELMDVARTKAGVVEEVAVNRKLVTDTTRPFVLSTMAMRQTVPAEDIENPEIQTDHIAEDVAVPVDGIESFERYIRRSLIYPPDARKNKEQGDIVLTFLINGEGRPYQIRAIKGFSRSCNREAIRLLAEGPAWTYTGKAQQASVTIQFRLK